MKYLLILLFLISSNSFGSESVYKEKKNVYALYITDQGLKEGLISYFPSDYDFSAKRNCEILKLANKNVNKRSLTCEKIK